MHRSRIQIQLRIACGIALLAVAALIVCQLPSPKPVQAAQQSTPASATPSAGTTPQLTWAQDIAPILYKNCTTCHHAGGEGPFNLITYRDTRRWAPQITRVIQNHFMPPWLPEPGYGNFSDVRRLSDEQIATIQQWIKSGMPEGDPAKAPAPPHYDETWQLGKPDLILTMDQAWTLPSSGTDVFRNFIFPTGLTTTKYVRAMEIIPGTPYIVHHANVLVDRTASLRRKHPDDWQQGVSGMELTLDAGNTFDPDSNFLFWKPDTVALVEPDGMQWRLDPGNDLILNIHMKPSGKPEKIQAKLGLYFTDTPPKYHPMLLQLDRDDILNIPPNDKNFVVEDSITLPVDVKVLGIYPHAHYIGREMQGWAILPNGEKKWLIWIKNWDIDRQSVYRYSPAIYLPKGTTLYMRYVYDNSSDNIHNPNSPPKWVHAGNRSEDEMSHMWLQLLPVNTQPGSPDPRLLIEEAWMRNRLRKSPNDRISLYNLAAALTAEGRPNEAIATFEQELKVTPGDARTLTALAAAELSAGQYEHARTHFEEAIAAKGTLPEQVCDARYDLAMLDLQQQSFPRAESDLRAMLATCPNDTDAHTGLGRVLAAEGKPGDAIAEFNQALAQQNGNPKALLGLGEVLLDGDQADKAVTYLEQAAQADPSSADTHMMLARAYAQSGYIDRALDELKTASTLRPDDASIHSALAQVLAGQGSFESAIVEQKLALRLNANDPDGWNNLGVLSVRTGDLDAARAAFEQALKLDPNHEQARRNLDRLSTVNAK